MREIVFRGKSSREWKNVKSGQWVNGCLWHHTDKASIIYSDELDDKVWVFPNTVGQFIGLTDKRGKKAFEHDVIRHHFGDEIGVIRFGQYRNPFGDDEFGGHVGFYVDWIAGTYPQTLRKDLGYWMQMVEVIGNIHDNPELLEVGADGN